MSKESRDASNAVREAMLVIKQHQQEATAVENAKISLGKLPTTTPEEFEKLESTLKEGTPAVRQYFVSRLFSISLKM